MLCLLLSSLLIAACGGDDEPAAERETAQDAPADTAEVSTTDTAEPEQAPEEEPPTDAPPDARGNIDGSAVELRIVELARSGETSSLTIGLVTQPGEDRAQISRTFDNGVFDKVKGVEDSIIGGSTLDGISLIDTANKKLYLAARDESGQCVCDIGLGSVFIEDDVTTTLSTTFGAPPPDVEMVDVMIPNFGKIKDAPID